ncbi:hypothetical protein AAMO2058_001124000 [Amorphochlora amoebiformis]|uniref:CNNM transmembrane domain-containing protein n=1 Tax=Amorphochlora amoebiformis TaxID=1561963 RepID=A0A7S0GX20_9EUKA|mmetsp:Transcript_20590/g.32643  ORF Transcript_20590/g.32643 Transcript_20590/m.32643 type:complete len:592 (+) Transcript_20590:210-1985(+)
MALTLASGGGWGQSPAIPGDVGAISLWNCASRLGGLSLSPGRIESPCRFSKQRHLDLDTRRATRQWRPLGRKSRCQRGQVLRGEAMPGGVAVVSVATLLSLSAFFSLSETAITTLWPWKIRELAMQEGRDSPFYAIRQDISRLLTSILIGNTFANIAATAILTQMFQGGPGLGISAAVILLLCEIMPKAIAVRHPVPVARLVVYPLSLIALILYPLGKFCTYLAGKLLKLFGVRETKMPIVSELELRMVLSGAENSGEVTNAEADMVENVLELGNIAVEKVMTPLVDVTAVDVNASLMEMWRLWKTYQYSRVPVFSKRVDNIVGIAFSRDLVNFIDRPDIMEEAKVTEVMEAPPLYVPESMTVKNLLQEFQQRNLHIAFVVNEYGGVVGLVTMEDALEEIVGEIFDETDTMGTESKIKARNTGVWDVGAETSIDELAEVMGVEFPEEKAYETVAGFVLDQLGAIPQPGAAFNVTLPLNMDKIDMAEAEEGEEDSYEKEEIFRVLVVKADPRSVQQVRIESVKHASLATKAKEVEADQESRIHMVKSNNRLDLVKARRERAEKLFELVDDDADDNGAQTQNHTNRPPGPSFA